MFCSEDNYGMMRQLETILLLVAAEPGLTTLETEKEKHCLLQWTADYKR